MFPFIPFRWSILTAITLVCALSLVMLGCGGGGGGGGNPVGAVDQTAITSTLRSFMMAASKGDLNAASQGLSHALRSSAAASSVIATFTFMDFGDDFYDSRDDGSWTFYVRTGGIVALSSDLAEINAECLSRSGTLIKLYFLMIRDQGIWLIDDIQIEGIQNDIVDAVSYFPLDQGDSWEYLEDDGLGNTNLIVRSIASAPEIINGDTVYSIVQTTQPIAPSLRGQIRQPSHSIRLSRPSIAGAIRPLFQSGSSVERFSIHDGLYFYGADSSFNNNLPLEIIALNAAEGETNLSLISLLVSGMRYEADVEILIKPTEKYVTPIQTYDAIPVQITVTWRQIPPGETPQQRETWFVAQDVGLIGRQIHDPNNLDVIVSRTALQKATINGVTIGEPVETMPVLVSVTPTDGTTGVATTTVVTATFNQPMSLASLQSSGFTISALGTAVTGTITTAGNVATFTPSSPLVSNTLITATIATGTLDANGLILAQGRTWTFTTAVPSVPASFVKGADDTVLEDSGNRSVANWATSIFVPTGNPVFAVTNDNNALFSVQPTFSSTGMLSYTPATNANGAAVLSITLGSDAPGVTPSAVQVATITVTPVNDPPSFVKGPDVFVTEDPSEKTFTNWATSVVSGPANESGQAISFTVGVPSPSAFSTLPVIDANGTLTLTPMSAYQGTYIATASLADNGGTAYGGSDTSTIQSFRITVTATMVTLNLTDSYPNAGNAVGQDATLILAFDQPMDLNDLAGRLSLTVAGGTAVPLSVANLSSEGNRVYITPTAALSPGTAQLNISAGALGLSGATLSSAGSISFEVVAINGINTPSITSPLADATMVILRPYIFASAFSPTGGLMHSQSDWEIYESATISLSNRVWYFLGLGGPATSFDLGDGTGTYANSHAGLTSLKPGTDYWVRVKYYGDTNGFPPLGVSQWSSLSKFTTSFPPNQPSITYPAPNELTPTIPTVTASALSDPDAGDTLSLSDWQVWETTNTTIFTNLVWESNPPNTSTSVNIDSSSGLFQNSLSGYPNLIPLTTYYLRVKYYDSVNLESPWSELVPFQVDLP